ncbi:MAG: hypothetical protein OXG82_05395 [Gammaproteobacteria bacterium]|nr:hypothetical protein [Gammaproteobacteria bacterium]
MRDFLRRMLPPRYYVTSGHLIDPAGRISPQLDVIIADGDKLPSLLKTNDGTEFVPAASVFAIGEVKSTYHRSKRYFGEFCKTLGRINGELSRPVIENTAFEPSPSSDMRHLLFGSKLRHLNHLFAFLLCVDAGDFQIGNVAGVLNSTSAADLPNTAVFLNGDGAGVLVYARLAQKGLAFHKYPIEAAGEGYRWCLAPGDKIGGSPAAAHLAMFYGQLFDHLAGSQLEHPSAYEYTRSLAGVVSKSRLQWVTDA